MRFAPLLLVLALPLVLHAQADDPLTVTLSSGKVLHFQTEDQKSAFLAARAHTAAGAATPTPTPASAQSQPTPAVLGGTALDEKPAMSGKVNVGAPTFTADYYLLEPETWVGKQITLSVAYLRPVDTAPRPDGTRELLAHTWGIVQSRAWQRYGGTLRILATPDAASRILPLCGSTIQYTGSGTKMTLIKGQFTLLTGENGGAKRYGMIVTQ